MRDRGAQLEGHHAGLDAVDVPQRAREQLDLRSAGWGGGG